MTQTFNARDIMLLLFALFGLALFMETRTATASPHEEVARIVGKIERAGKWHMMQMAHNEQGDAFGPWSN